MDALTDIFDEIELICHDCVWEATCSESIREWNNKSKQSTFRNKKSKSYPWHKPRCGYIYDNGKYCEHKSYFSGISRHEKHDIDACDRKVFCYIHKKYQYKIYEKQSLKIEKIILQRIEDHSKLNKELFITEENKKYINQLKEKYSKNHIQ